MRIIHATIVFFAIMNKDYFQNKIVWITGASSGIGKATALALEKKGAILVLSARDEVALNGILETFKYPKKHLVLPLDLTKADQFDSLRDRVVERFERIDILINNGGISQRSEAFDTDVETVRRIFEVDFFGHIALTKSVLSAMRKQKIGQVLVISSIAGKFGFFQRSSYSAAKHALHGYFESLALEEEKNGISVTIACPGKINTPISIKALKGDGSAHNEYDANQAGGLSAEDCANELLTALVKKKREVLIGGKEIWAVYIKRFFPALFWRIIRKQSPV
jgi:dehydrogenase/reductase SDR family member 7B